MTPERLAEIESKQCAEITCEECEAQRSELIAALRECRREALREAAEIAETKWQNGLPAWRSAGRDISAAILALESRET